MSRKDFHLLLQRYTEGTCTPAERIMVDKWYDLLEKENSKRFTSLELGHIENELWEKISGDQEQTKEFVKKLSMTRVLAIAAGLVLLLTGTYMVARLSQVKRMAQKTSGFSWRTVKNTGRGSQTIKLEDSSVILLDAGSQVSFPGHFSGPFRQVRLLGSAFFTVSHDAARPFLVYHREVVVKVVGTSFRISENTRSNTVVAVRTGRVVVTCSTRPTSNKPRITASPGNATTVTLDPNQKTIWNHESRQFQTTLVDVPLPVEKARAKLVPEQTAFNDTPIGEVVAQLTKSYLIRIDVTPELSSQTFTGDLTDVNLYNKLSLICRSLHANYRVEGTRIILTESKTPSNSYIK